MRSTCAYSTASPTGDGIANVTLGNGRGAFGGTGLGDQIEIHTFGTDRVQQINGALGIYDNNDPFKGGPINARSVILAGQIQVIDGVGGLGDFDNSDGTTIGANNRLVNDFFQNGQQQDIGAQFGVGSFFGFWLTSPVSPWPDGAFPP